MRRRVGAVAAETLAAAHAPGICDRSIVLGPSGTDRTQGLRRTASKNQHPLPDP